MKGEQVFARSQVYEEMLLSMFWNHQPGCLDLILDGMKETKDNQGLLNYMFFQCKSILHFLHDDSFTYPLLQEFAR